MGELEALKRALARERKAKKLAENTLEVKALELYEQNQLIKNQREQLLQSEKMSSMGYLAAGIAHEINNPLGFSISNINTLGEYIDDISEVVNAYQDLLKNFVNSNAQGQQVTNLQQLINEKDLQFIFEDSPVLLDETKDGLDRIKKIVNSMKVFAHQGDEALAPVDINECVNDAVRLTSSSCKDFCELELKFAQDLPPVYCLADQIVQVLVNFITNAFQAMESEGKIVVITDRQGDNARVRVSDNGPGIPDEIQRNVFDPFFTTKPVGSGTGLGLAITYNIIENHGGKIRLTSKVGKGTTFAVTLPFGDETTVIKKSEAFGGS